MTFNFAELTQKLRAGGETTHQDVLDMVTAGPGATFALVEFAAEYRRMYFRNTIEVVNLLGTSGQGSEPVAGEANSVDVGAGESSEELAQRIFDLSGDDSAQRITVNFLVPSEDVEASGASSLTPMQCLRILAAVRLSAPAKSVRVGVGRGVHLRSLQSLALHCVDSLYLSNHEASEPRAIFEDLKLFESAGLSVIGAEHLDLKQEYVTFLQDQGVEDAQSYADDVFVQDDDGAAGGCGGNCACGSGGCGSPEDETGEPEQSGCGCGAGGCGAC